MKSKALQISLEEIRRARERLRPVVRLTPLLRSLVYPTLHFKAENLQLTGSFKVRPAYHQLIRLSPEQRAKGVVTSSSGNFAQGVAWAARQLGVNATVVMMRSSNPLKVARTQALGAQVVFCEDSFQARLQKVAEIRNREGRVEVYPYDHPDVIAANGSVGLEILEQWSGKSPLRQVVVPVSGGGLISGVAAAIKQASPQVRLIGVQAAGSDATYRSFHARQPIAIERAVTIADGLMVTQPGVLTFPLILEYVDDMLVVQETSIREAVRHLAGEEKLVVEPSGAVTLAAVLEEQVSPEGTVLVLSGGNINPPLLAEILSQG